MKCHEVESLLGPYLDSELDTHTTEQMRRHLEQCPGCAARFRSEASLDLALRRRLGRDSRSEALWREEEQYIERALHQETASSSQVGPIFRKPVAPKSVWREWLWPSPVYYAGLAFLWICMLALRWTWAEPATASRNEAAQSRVTPEMKTLLVQQRQTLQELLMSQETTSPQEEVSPSPRSEFPSDRRALDGRVTGRIRYT